MESYITFNRIFSSSQGKTLRPEQGYNAVIKLKITAEQKILSAGVKPKYKNK